MRKQRSIFIFRRANGMIVLKNFIKFCDKSSTQTLICIIYHLYGYIKIINYYYRNKNNIKYTFTSIFITNNNFINNNDNNNR